MPSKDNRNTKSTGNGLVSPSIRTTPRSGAERRLFGTDGVRGEANQYPMTCEVALALGRAVAHQARAGQHRHRILIGKDTRLSGYMIEMAFASGVCSMGVDALLLGPLPTPAVAFLTRDMRADAGVMISASHNPYEDNGVKIFARDGFKLPDEKELELEHFMEDEGVGAIRPTRSEVGKAFRIDDACGRYVVALKRVFPEGMELTGMKVVLDCAHGAAYRVAPMVLEELGAEVIAVGVKPDGRNINAGCGALYPKNLADQVTEHGADAGIALDGDADRVIVVDETGAVVDGDRLLAIAAGDLLRDDRLTNRTLVTTVMSNLALDLEIERLGGRVVRTQVGDRYVVEEMRRSGYVLGGEQSGHIVYLDHATTGDGMVAALKLLAIMQKTGQPLSRLKQVLDPFPQSLVSIRVKEKRPLEELTEAQSLITSIERDLGKRGRVMVRYSGTEAKARVLVEGPDPDRVQSWAIDVAEALGRALS